MSLFLVVLTKLRMWGSCLVKMKPLYFPSWGPMLQELCLTLSQREHYYMFTEWLNHNISTYQVEPKVLPQEARGRLSMLCFSVF